VRVERYFLYRYCTYKSQVRYHETLLVIETEECDECKCKLAKNKFIEGHADEKREKRTRQSIAQAHIHSSQNQLLRVKCPGISQQLHFAHRPLRLDVLLHFFPRVVLNRLDQNTESCRDGTMVRDIRFISLVM